jgi:two-component system NtrC family response regulator
MTDGKRLTEKDLELGDAAERFSASTLRRARESAERESIQNTLKKHLGRISSAAAEFGVSRPTLYELMEKLGVKKAGTFIQSSST